MKTACLWQTRLTARGALTELRSPSWRAVFLAFFVLATGVWIGVNTPRCLAADPPQPMNSPDEFAWNLFAQLNTEVPGTNGKVLWETWALARDVFADPTTPPEWPEPSPDRRTLEDAEPLLQQMIAQSHRSQGDGPVPAFDPDAPSINETRMNREAFEFIVNNDLYYLEGQEDAFDRGVKIDFPIEAKEIKARWEPINPANAGQYHTAIVHNPNTGESETWGLKALHITTKDIPNWFWATFEHVDNPAMERVVRNRDSHNLPSELEGTKWENYVLRGTQTDFVDSTGVPIVLANSIIEAGFQASSSCMTCHARATIGPRAGQFANRLTVFESFLPVVKGSIGMPDQELFWDLARGRRRYLQLDFVWSLFRAGRRSSVPSGADVDLNALAIQPDLPPFRRPHAADGVHGAAMTEGIAEMLVRDGAAFLEPGIVPGGPAHREIESSNSFHELATRRQTQRQAIIVEVDASGLEKERFEECLVLAGPNATADRDLGLIRITTPATEAVRELAKIPGIEIYDVTLPRPPSHFPPPTTPLNLHARDTHQVDEAVSAHGLSGHGVLVGVWDGGKVRATHDEFAFDDAGVTRSRVRQADAATQLSEHATHVTGTITAEGKVEPSRGMAVAARVVAHDWFDDTTEMNARAADGCACSNHSYGIPYGWEWNLSAGHWEWYGPASATTDERFGVYTPLAKEFDDLAVRNPSLSIFVAAGNDRSNNPAPGTSHVVMRTGQVSTTTREGDGRYANGYDTLGAYSVAKNVITIGAIDDIRTDPPMPGDVEPTRFTSWGPTDDRRIKPDLVANGFRLESTSATGDDQYSILSGTSMATPTASGIGALIVECFRNRGVAAPRSDQMKAVLIHTAMSPHEGPSYEIGWGSIRADLAANLIAGDGGSLIAGSIRDSELNWTGDVMDESRIRVTLTWIDPTSTGTVEKELVNDLDVHLIAPDGTTQFFPWSLDGSIPDAAATASGPNRVDNVERIDIDAPANGEWKIVVRWPDGPHTKDQQFSLAVSGMADIEQVNGDE